ncbi:MAG TPA: hypothetical protein DCF95_10165 [Gammaproteobacteria bacterium]|nr:hypothetical protein [Gammaproteobacteria bacterium]|tara:strand:- start:1810 stop:3204 length:1395 start_codon:yes stop_codon:yes gene_type:complete
MTVKSANLQGKKILFVAYFYPPSDSTGVPGSMRTVKFVRNLSNGECHVLTMPPAVTLEKNALSHINLPVNGEQIHRAASWDIFRLLLSVRQSLRKILGKASRSDADATNDARQTVFKSTSVDDERPASRFQRFKDFVYNLCYFPDQAGPWIIPAFIAGRRIVRRRNLDAIFATGSPWSGLVTGYLISKTTGKPLIADFRDPWMNNPFHQSKGKLLDFLSARLERKVVQQAIAVSLNTEPLREEFLERYPHLCPDKFFVMPNGFDQADFADIEPEERQKDDTTLLLCHAGFLYGVRDPAVLLEAIRAANIDLNAYGKQVVFRQIGSVQLNYDIKERFCDLLETGALVLEAPKPYQQCLSALASADAVVNIQPATQSQIPSKLYDYLGINRPIINITASDGALGKLVRTKNLGALADFDEIEKLTGILITEALNSTHESFRGYPNRFDFDVKQISSVLAEKIVKES